MAKKLTTKLDKITEPGLYCIGDTLYLRVSKAGGKQYVQRLTINRKRHDLGLGPCSKVSFEKAQYQARKNLVAVFEGIDVLAERRRAAMPTFRLAAELTHKALSPKWRSAKVAANWIQQLERHAFPKLGTMQVDKITRDDLLQVLAPIWNSKPEAARRVRRGIKQTLAWAEAHGHVTMNLAGSAIDGALVRHKAVKSHLRALPYAELPEAINTIAGSNAGPAAKLALRFLVLTAARSGDVRGARWDEIDRDSATWTIPAARMKAGKEHRVPLSAAALDVLDEAAKIGDGSGLLFPSPARPGNPLSDMTLTKVLRTTGLAEQATVHGMRSTFRTWASERTNADHAVMELSLAHAVGSAVEQAYARSDLIAKRRALMDRWAAFATGKKSTVVALHG